MAFGGRTRTRTLDPLIKTQQVASQDHCDDAHIWRTAADIDIGRHARLTPRAPFAVREIIGSQGFGRVWHARHNFLIPSECALVSLTHSFQSQSACFALSLRLSS